MTSEQAAQLIQQQQTLLDHYAVLQPLAVQFVRDFLPPAVVALGAVLGVLFGRAAT